MQFLLNLPIVLKTLPLLAFVLIAAGCGPQQPTNQAKPAQPAAQSPSQGPTSEEAKKENLKGLLVAASPETTTLIFDDSKWPLNTLDVQQSGNHAVYVKSQQPDEGSLNFVLLGFDYKSGRWVQFGGASNNYLFADGKTQTGADTTAIMQKLKGMEDKYFAENVGEDFARALSAQDYPAAASLFAAVQNKTAGDIQDFVAQHGVLKKTSGFAINNYEGSATDAMVTVYIDGTGGTLKVDLSLTKENGAWKISGLSAE